MAYTHPLNPVGPVTTLHVKKGDKISLEVFTQSAVNNDNINVIPPDIGQMLSNGVNFEAVGAEGSDLPMAAASLITEALSMVTAGSSGEPKAYLQYILLDVNFNRVGGDEALITGEDPDGDGWELLKLTDEVAFDGYLYAYVVNESDKDVYFDDFTVQIMGPRAIRKTDYYPFGAVAKQWNNPS